MTLFQFGNVVRCDCGSSVDLSVGHLIVEDQPEGEDRDANPIRSGDVPVDPDDTADETPRLFRRDFFLIISLVLVAWTHFCGMAFPDTFSPSAGARDNHTVLLLNLDEGEGVVIHDSSGRRPELEVQQLVEGPPQTWPRPGAKGHGVLSTPFKWGGYADWCEGRFGSGLYTEHHHVLVSNLSDLLNANQGTIELWICPMAQKDSGIVSLGGKPALCFAAGSDRNEFGRVYGQWDSTSRPRTGFAPVEIRQWSHVALVWNGPEWMLYVNGKLEQTVFVDEKQRTFSNKVCKIGSYTADKEKWFRGMFDEVRISNIARTPDSFLYRYSPRLDWRISVSDADKTDLLSAFQLEEGHQAARHVPQRPAQPVPDGFSVLGSRAPERSQTAPRDWTEVVSLDSTVVYHRRHGGVPVHKARETYRTTGFLVFARHYSHAVDKYAIPFDDELQPSLRAFASRGEYEPMTFSIRTLRSLKQVKVELGDLVSVDGYILPRENVDVRVVRHHKAKVGDNQFRLVPRTLEKWDALDLAPYVTQRYWLTVYVPPDAKRGLYTGEVVISSVDKESRTLPVSVRVLPIRLDESGMMTGSFFLGRLEGCNRAKWIYPENYLKIFVNYREHGLNSVVLWEVRPELSYRNGKIQVDMSETDRIIQGYQAAGLTNPVGLEIRTVHVWCDKLGRKLAEIKGKGQFPKDVDLPGVWMNTPDDWDLDYKPNAETVAAYKEVITQIVRIGKERGWPDLYFLPEEETNSRLQKFIAVREFAKIIKQIPGARSMLVDNSNHAGIDRSQRLDEFVDYRCYHGVNKGIIENAARSGDPLFAYNHGYGRVSFGWFARNAELNGVLQWADQWSDEDPYEDLPGHMWFFCFPSPDGPLTTPHSEGTREGVDDLRYVRTLERLVSHCGCSDNHQWKHQSEEAEKYIRSVLEKVSVDREWRTAADGADLDVVRWKVASYILKLQDVIRPH